MNDFFAASADLEKYPFDISKAYQKLYMRPLNEVRLEGYIALNMTVTENEDQEAIQKTTGSGNDEEVNRGINPLPNLDFKFVSLICFLFFYLV